MCAGRAQVTESEEVFAAYELAHAAIEQYMHNTHNEWFGTIENNISKELQACLLTQDKASGELLGLPLQSRAWPRAAHAERDPGGRIIRYTSDFYCRYCQ